MPDLRYLRNNPNESDESLHSRVSKFSLMLLETLDTPHHRRPFPPGRPQSGDNERRVTVTPEPGLPEGNEALLVRRDSPA